MVQKPPISLPSLWAPMLDPRSGILTEVWRGFFSDLVSPATPIQVVTVSASPFTFTAIHIGSLLVVGGTVSQIDLIRARVTVTTGLIAGFIPMSQNDQVVLTYTVLPSVWYIPNGNPA